MTDADSPTADRDHCSTATDDPLLSVDNLHTYVRTDRGRIRAVDGVSFDVHRGETVCLVGESGSGKTATCESLTGLIRQPPADITEGSVRFDGTELRGAPESAQQRVRGNRIGHVFQNPQRALDPVYTVGEQIIEAITLHRDSTASAAREQAIDLLGRVGLPRPSARVDEYPHELSSGMQQRVALAIALAADPDLLIADEPTTALDVTVQAKLLGLLEDLISGGMALLLVTHDLRVAAALADRVLVMYGGTLVESGPVSELFDQPAHPYTQALFDSFRGVGTSSDPPARDEVPTDGCRFRTECPHAVEACAGGTQPADHSIEGDDGHRVSCVYYGSDRDAGPILRTARSLGGDEE